MNHRMLFPMDDEESPKPESKPKPKPRTRRKTASKTAAKPDTPTRSQRLFSDFETKPQTKTTAPTVDDGPVTLPIKLPTEPLSELGEVENKLIRASAGTGKTYQLTSRFLRLLLLDVAPETILATTFTRKAAGEILDRVVTWLGHAAIDPDELRSLAHAVDLPELTHEHCLSKLAVLARQMHRLQIHTIDAFFMQMAMSFSLELGMTPGWQVLEEGGPESNAMRQEAISGVLRQESLDDLLTLVHQIAPKGEAKRSLDRTLQGSVSQAYRLFLQSSEKAWDQLTVPPPLPDDELDDVRQAMANYDDGKGRKKPRKGITEALRQDVNRIVNEDWAGFFGAGKSMARYVNEGKEKYGNAKLNAELIELYERFLPHLRSMTLFSARAQTLGTHRFLSKYHAEYKNLKEGQRLYGFNEVTELLAEHTQVGDLSQLAFRMDHGIDHLLLDEFQDTSITQWRALASLAKRCSEAESNRSFFCVGDVKQAIYGWRGGSSEIFDILDKKLPNLIESDLQESRRSSQVVIDAVNQIFETLPKWDTKRLGRADRAATKFEFPEHTTYHANMPGYFAIETSDNAASSREAQESALFRRAAERVAAISKQAKGRTIGILCRRNNKVGQMMNELQRLGIAASEEGGNYLTDSAAVELVLSLLHLTDHPSDSVTAYHLASSPWGRALGLNVGACKEYQWEDDDPKKDAPDRPRPPAGIDPKAIGSLVRQARAHLLHDGFGDTVQAWATQLRGFCNRREARRLTQLVEKAYEYQNKVESPTQLGYQLQRRQSTRPSEFARFIRETKFADPSNSTIRVMTVHQAKGLEFDIVVLPDLLGPFIEGHETFLYGRPNVEADVDLVCRYMGKDSGRSFLPKKFLPLFDEFEDRSARESFCVMYVALTRAAHALHIFLPSGMQKLRGSKGHPGYLIKDAFIPGQELEPATTMFEMGESDWFLNCDQPKLAEETDTEEVGPQPKLARSRKQRRHLETVAPSQIGNNRFVQVSDRLSRKRNSSRDRGTVVHRWLAEITWRDAIPPDEKLLSLAESFTQHLDVAKTLKQFNTMLKSEELRDILDKKKYLADLRASMPSLPPDFRVEVRQEQPVAGRDGNQIVSGTIDRLILVRSPDGKLLAAEIIDFKTDQDATQSERYEMQIAAYRRVIASSLRIENVSTRLVFLT